MNERTIAELTAYHWPRLQQRMAQAVKEHRIAMARERYHQEFCEQYQAECRELLEDCTSEAPTMYMMLGGSIVRPGDSVTISGLTGPNAKFNGTHVIGGGADA